LDIPELVIFYLYKKTCPADRKIGKKALFCPYFHIQIYLYVKTYSPDGDLGKNHYLGNNFFHIDNPTLHKLKIYPIC
jgi:hypothetical protein